MSPLLLWKEVCPGIDPVGSLVDNLQKRSTASIVKDSIVTAIPDCPDQSANPYSDSRFGCFIYPVQPIAKHVLNISRGGMLNVNWTTLQISLLSLHLIKR
jgi:hypothetical protein